MKVQDVFTPGTVHIPRTCNLQEAARQMRDQHVGALVVTNGAGTPSLLGIVTDRDLALKAMAQGASPLETTVGDVMSSGALTVDVSADVDDAMQLMASHGVRRLAVTNRADEVLGMISLDDVIQALGRDWAMLAGIVRGGQQRERSGSVQSRLHP